MRTSEGNNSNKSARLSKMHCTCPEDHSEDNFFSRIWKFHILHQISYEFLSTFWQIFPISLSKLHSKRSDEHLRDFVLRQKFHFLLVGIRGVNFVIFSRNCLIILSKAHSSCIEDFFWAVFPENFVFYSCFRTLVEDFSLFWELFLLGCQYCLERVQKRC